jgi:flagellin
MVDSINNSSGVLGALRYLQGANKDISAADGRLATGLKIDKARDGAAQFQSAAIMKGEEGSLKAVSLSLSHARSVSDIAIAGGEQISKLLTEMRTTALSAVAPDLTADQRQVLSDTFEQQKVQLNQFINSAEFDDANLLDGSRPNGVSFIADAEARQVLNLEGRDFRPGHGVVTMLPGDDLSDPFEARAVYDKLTQSLSNVGDQLTQMSAESRRVQAQIGFVAKLADALAGGVSRLVDTDLAAEGALIQALQIKQQLSAQAIGIINDAPQSLLSLFRAQ